MTVTLSTIRNRIGERLQDPSFRSISSASIDDVVNQSLKYYKFRRFWFNESVAEITLTQGVSIVPNIPTDLLQELPDGAFTIFYSNVYYPLQKSPTNIFDSENVSATGLPFIYTFRNNQYEVYFLPNIAYDLFLRYLKDYNDLDGDNSTNDFLKYADMMIYYNALSRIFGEYKQDPTMEAYYTARATDEETNVSRRTTALSGTGQLSLNSNLL